MGDEGKTVTTTADSSPWGPQQPYLTEGFSRAKGLLDQGPQQYYPGQSVADASAQTLQGQNHAMQQGQGAANLAGYTMGGGFLNSGNPYFQGMVNQIGQAIRPNIDSAFAGSGRLGSGAHANAYASALADKAGTLAYQNYGDERQRQIAASQDYSGVNAMMGVGQQVEGKDKEYIADALARWNFGQTADQTALSQYMNTVGGAQYGGQRSSTQPLTGNSTMQGIGTGLAGLGALGQGLPGLLSLFK